MRRVKKAWVSSSAMPSRWSTQPSMVMLMLKVKSPMTAKLLQVEWSAELSLVDKYLVAANAKAQPRAHQISCGGAAAATSVRPAAAAFVGWPQPDLNLKSDHRIGPDSARPS